MKNVLKFSEEDFEEICYNQHEEFDLIERIEGQSSRRSIKTTIIVKNIETGKLYMGKFNKGSTKIQDDLFFNTELVECEQVEVKRLEWKVIE